MSEKRSEEELELIDLGDASEETKAPFYFGAIVDQANPIRYWFPLF